MLHVCFLSGRFFRRLHPQTATTYSILYFSPLCNIFSPAKKHEKDVPQHGRNVNTGENTQSGGRVLRRADGAEFEEIYNAGLMKREMPTGVEGFSDEDVRLIYDAGRFDRGDPGTRKVQIQKAEGKYTFF